MGDSADATASFPTGDSADATASFPMGATTDATASANSDTSDTRKMAVEKTLKTLTKKLKLLERRYLLSVTSVLLIEVVWRVLCTGVFRCLALSDMLNCCAIVLMIVALCAALTAYAHRADMEERKRFLWRTSYKFIVSSFLIQLVSLAVLVFAIALDHDVSACAGVFCGNIAEKFFMILAAGADVTHWSFML